MKTFNPIQLVANFLVVPSLVLTMALVSACPAQTSAKASKNRVQTSQKNAPESGDDDKSEAKTKPTVELDGFEIVWPKVEGFERFVLQLQSEKETRTIKQTGDEPSFNALEEEVTEGKYRYRLTYSDQKLAKSNNERKAAFANRRQLLKKRLEVLEAGDREGAKKLMEQANQVRANQRSNGLDVSTMLKHARSSKKTVAGVITVHADGKVEVSDIQAEASEKQSTKKKSSKF